MTKLKVGIVSAAPSFRQALHVQEVVEAILSAQAERRWVRFCRSEARPERLGRGGDQPARRNWGAAARRT